MNFFHWLNHVKSNKSPRQRARRAKCRLAVEKLEDRIQPSASIEPINGMGNNPINGALGSAGSDLIRIAPAAYADGMNAPSGTNRPSARDISNALSDQTDPSNTSQDLNIPNAQHLSDFIYVFGQFLDHDLDLTNGGNPAEAFNILVDQTGDPFNPPGVIPFTRSEFDLSTGTGPGNPRQQINEVTSFLDGSQIYGSDDQRASLLRTHIGGKLKTSPGDLLPLDNAAYFGASAPITMANDANIVPTSQLFVAGDVRANENIELTAMQTLFMREHNRIADQLQAAHPKWTDEQIYQQARSVVIAELQVITYKEWLPALLGPNALKPYSGYNAAVNPGISNEFSTAMFRFAHSQLDNGIDRLNNDGSDIADGSVDLAQAFFNPTLVNPAGVTDGFSGHVSTDIDPILKGAASGDAQEVDLLAVRDIRNLLFGPPGAGGSDLIARDIQRGRDHGLTDYNSMRAAYGLPRVTTFSQITSDPQVAAKLQQLYGNVDNIDVFVGALAEDHVPGADVGPLTKAVLVNQFTRLRDGDRFWYQRVFSGWDLAAIQKTTLADVIRRNTGLTNLQDNVFFFNPIISGKVFLDRADDGHREFAGPGMAGLTVRLLDANGALVATTLTGRDGNYRFDSLSIGTYSVQVVLPDGFVQTTPPRTIKITRSMTVDGVNVGIRRVGTHDSHCSSPLDSGFAEIDDGFGSPPGSHGSGH